MKTAIVTGGSRGIGYAISAMLCKNGFRVVVFGRSPQQKVKEILDTLPGAIYVQGDISNEKDREKCLAAAGGVDVLVNNAGVAPKERIDMLEITESDYDYVMDANLKGTFFLTQMVAKDMVKTEKPGYIVNISSVSAYTSSVNRAQYCISKAGIGMMTKLFADRLADHGVMVYEIRPGIIQTDMTKSVTEKYNRMILEEGITPIKRWGMPNDVAKAVMSLVKGEFPFSTGEVFNVDGGFHLRRL
ncbi:MAG: 3-ketoacyl-ACP reductase [Firmicutes bacterium]|nr:3-ketoacyl-ACP reductase [Bacillota bacterium]